MCLSLVSPLFCHHRGFPLLSQTHTGCPVAVVAGAHSMPKSDRFDSFREFRNDLVHGGRGSIGDAIEELAAELYHTQVDLEFDTLWDKADGDDA